jgi:hypothetical protein
LVGISRREDRRGQFTFGDLADFAVDLVRRFSAAKRADQFLLGWIPFRLRAAGGAGIFV